MEANESIEVLYRMRDRQLADMRLVTRRGANPSAALHYQTRALALDLAIAALEREHAERWRCVTTELPEIGIVQWCQVREAESRQAYIRNDGIWKDLQGRDVPVTHWRPLPEPAKEQEASRG